MGLDGQDLSLFQAFASEKRAESQRPSLALACRVQHCIGSAPWAWVLVVTSLGVCARALVAGIGPFLAGVADAFAPSDSVVVASASAAALQEHHLGQHPKE
mmetsp:Transcript_91974/g.177198  ORF Transcript_91974/g.177198 Transcript_91974/m.177198 type:complete len:101 (+) Transcript_91974:565-867(+)